MNYVQHSGFCLEPSPAGALNCVLEKGHGQPHRAAPLHPEAPGLWWRDGTYFEVIGRDADGYPVFERRIPA